MTRQVYLHIDPDRCRTWQRCLAAQSCKVRAIVHIDPEEPPFLDVSRCYDWRLCIPACPLNAIQTIPSSYPMKAG
jgi:Fe-S-cluster-containing hydrogenase component 2